MPQPTGRSTPSAAHPLEPSGAEMRHLVGAALERIIGHLESLATQPSWDLEGATELARSLEEPMPEAGAPLDEVLDVLFERAVPKSFNTAGPGYLAYIPGGGIFHAAVADLIADAVNRYVGVWVASPALVQLETNVVRWFCDLLDFPAGARGVLTSGGSLANFSAIVTARRERLPDDFLRGTIYVSDQAHHSVHRAAALAGFPESSIREVPSDSALRMRMDELEQMITADRREGRAPFLLVASGGTVNTGAVDDLDLAAEVAARQDLWLHVDGAYGGFFVMTERGRRALRGIERADSVTLDPHKGLFLPYGTGSLLVRDGSALARAHALGGAYLPAMRDGEEFVDFCQLSPELSRDFRGLRVWLPLKLVGAAAFRQSLDEKLDLTQWAAAELRAIEGLRIVAEPQLSIVAFRLERPGLGAAELNGLNQRLLERINARRRVYMTGTTVHRRFIIRICVLSFRTHLDRMREGLEDIRAAVAELD